MASDLQAGSRSSLSRTAAGEDKARVISLVCTSPPLPVQRHGAACLRLETVVE